MHYIEVQKAGDPNVLRLSTMEQPQPKANEVLIRVMAAGVNRPDVMQRQGKYPPPQDASPILGLEVAGEIVALGQAVTNFKIGDKVCALTNGGGYAEYCVVPALQCLPWPKNYNAIQAAALPENYFTVWANVFQMGHLEKGESLLVHGGSSGIGITTIKLATQWGCTVYTTAGNQQKCEACLKFGAKQAINYHNEDFAEKIRDYTAGKGVNVILDMVGAPYFIPNLRSLAMDGRLIEIATMQGNMVNDFDIRIVMAKRLMITGSGMRVRTLQEKGAIAKDLLEKVWPILDAGNASPEIYQVFPLADAANAHALMESSAHIGKIILKVAD